MSRQACFVALAVSLLALSVIECKNVVLLPAYVTSHMRMYGLVANELVKLKHNVWMGMPSDDRHRIEVVPQVHTFWYDGYFESSVVNFSSHLETTIINAYVNKTEPDWAWLWQMEDDVAKDYFESFKDRNFIEFIGSLKPDFIVIDWYPSVNDHVAIPYKLNVPFAVLSALFYPFASKLPFSPVAEAFNKPYILKQASFFERAKAVYNYMLPSINHIFSDKGYMKQLFPDDPNTPTASELMSRAEVYIAETDPVFDYPRPSLPNFKLVGGISAIPAKELQEPFKSFVERSQKSGVGVAVLSFGTLILNLPKEVELKLMSVLKRIKFNTIWRTNVTSPDPNKILTSSWLPQNDLLGNKNVHLFMTHCGVHSLYEGIYHGVPMVCLPLFFDQFDNTDRFVDKGYCLGIDFITASEDQIVERIEEVASSQKIKSDVGKASQIYKEIYKDAKQETAFWLDHVMRYGGSYMRSNSQTIPMYLYFLDYLLVFGAGILFSAIFFIVCLIIKKNCLLFFKQQAHLKKD